MTTAPANDQHQLHLLREMLRIRRFEERCVELYSATKIRGFLHLYIGEEASAVGIMQALDPGERPRGGFSFGRGALDPAAVRVEDRQRQAEAGHHGGGADHALEANGGANLTERHRLFE